MRKPAPRIAGLYIARRRPLRLVAVVDLRRRPARLQPTRRLPILEDR